VKKRVCVIGGGAAGTSVLWCLTGKDVDAPSRLVLFHDENEIGGHSRTIPVVFDGEVGRVAPQGTANSHPVDIGVQFVCPTLYPNLYRQLELSEFSDIRLKRHAALRMSGAFTDDLVWGNFPAYQQGSRFSRCFDKVTIDHAERFQRDLHRSPLKRMGGKPIFRMSIDEYLKRSGIPRDGNFFRYLLIPYLCIINGYGTTDLLQTEVQDLYPIFTRLPIMQTVGPYASFTEPGYGWDRFADGATSWVKRMADVAVGRGAEVRLSSSVNRISRRRNEWIVEWSVGATYGRGGTALERGAESHSEAFDEIVFTTDMTTNLGLLDHDENPYRDLHSRYLARDRFRLLPGVCYIHQDKSLLAPCLTDEKEDGQFTGYFAWGKQDLGSDLYNLPYDLGATFQTYFMHNIMGTPAPCYVSMYAEDRAARVPAADKTIFRRTWRHGRWVASFFREAKRELHNVQGVGNLWFAGNNTTVDSEEGALISAMIIAAHTSAYRYPFGIGNFAWVMYNWFHEQMFPPKSLRSRVGRLLNMQRG